MSECTWWIIAWVLAVIAWAMAMYGWMKRVKEEQEWNQRH